MAGPCTKQRTPQRKGDVTEDVTEIKFTIFFELYFSPIPGSISKMVCIRHTICRSDTKPHKPHSLGCDSLGHRHAGKPA